MPPDERPAALAALLRSRFAEAEQRREQERQEQGQDEAAKKAAIRGLLERNQHDNDAGQAAGGMNFPSLSPRQRRYD